MSRRLNQEREKRLQPKRVGYAIQALSAAGFPCEVVNDTQVSFCFMNRAGRVVEGQFFPYSGWWSAKGLGSGRGVNRLMRALEKYRPAFNSCLNLNALEYSWNAIIRLKNGKRVNIWWSAWPMTKHITSEVITVYSNYPRHKISRK